MEAEREERKKYKQEQEEKHLKNHLAFKEMIEKARQEREAEDRANGRPVDQEENSQQGGELSDSQNDDQIPELEDAPSEDQKQEDTTENSQTLTTYNSEPSERPSTPSSNHSVRDKKGGFGKSESGASRDDSLNSSYDSKRKRSAQEDSSSERGDHHTDLPNLSATTQVNKTNYLDELE